MNNFKVPIVQSICFLFLLCFVYSVVMHVAFLLDLEDTLDNWSLSFILPAFFILPSTYLKYSREGKGLIKANFLQAKRLRLVLKCLLVYSFYNLGCFVIVSGNFWEIPYNEEKTIALMYSGFLIVASFYFSLFFIFGRSEDKNGKYKIIRED